MRDKVLRPRTKRNIRRLIPLSLIWLLSGWIFLVVELAAYSNVGELPDTVIEMDAQVFMLSSIFMVAVGLMIGLIELQYLQNAFVKHALFSRLFYKLMIYTILFGLIELITFPIVASLELNTSVFAPAVWEKLQNFFFSFTFLSTTLQLAIALLISLFYFEISEFIGFGVLRNFFTGKYKQAIEEERIFLFLDMKSSTTIAERLGHVAYFKLLQAYYACFTESIVLYEAAIYQYVGDEIILSWPVKNDQKNLRCLDCYFAMKVALEAKAPLFQELYGVVPSFKAGIHLGIVSTGEIGTIKKDILFSGDVLNACARIQSLCKTYGVDLIISEDLRKQIPEKTLYQISSLGKSELRGKAEHKTLYSLSKQ